MELGQLLGLASRHHAVMRQVSLPMALNTSRTVAAHRMVMVVASRLVTVPLVTVALTPCSLAHRTHMAPISVKANWILRNLLDHTLLSGVTMPLELDMLRRALILLKRGVRRLMQWDST